MRESTLERILACGIVPVVRVSTGDLALRAAEAVLAGGIDVVEITMTVPGALGIMESLVARHGQELVVGAGTVVDAETARACIDAGAAFVMSPIFDEETVRYCRDRAVPVAPGALTPTEIVRADRAGADLVKVFPCSAVGGASYVRALKAPFPHLRLLPTGGVSEATIADFILAGASAVGLGSELVDVAKLRQGDTAAVRDAARRCLQAVRRARAPRG